MSGLFIPTRREFLQTAGGAALTVVFARLAFAEDAPAHDWSGGPGVARSRIDGPAKVTGQKIYGRDFRARDMAGWPATERVAMVLRAASVDRLFEGIDLSSLPPALQPLRKIEQADLAADKIALPAGTMALPNGSPGLLVPAGEAPTYFGQPVAILIFRDFETWRRARRELQFDDSIVRYGDAQKPRRRRSLIRRPPISRAMPRRASRNSPKPSAVPAILMPSRRPRPTPRHARAG